MDSICIVCQSPFRLPLSPKLCLKRRNVSLSLLVGNTALKKDLHGEIIYITDVKRERVVRNKLAQSKENKNTTKIKNLFLFDILLSCLPNLQGKHFFFSFSYFGLIVTCFYLKLCTFLTSAHILETVLNVVAWRN